MSRVDVVRAAMVEAMKAKDKARKDSLSMLLSALKNAEIDKRSPLTEEEADAVVKKEIKQTKETLELAPADRADIREEAQARLAVYQEFAPEDLTEEQIAEVIKSVLAELGIAESGLDQIIKTAYSILNLRTFLTAGEDETRAWTIKIGTKAPQAAGKIHTDFERGFIKAEVVNYKDLLEQGSLAAAREKGLVGMEGKDYVVKDGDVILFRFNV